MKLKLIISGGQTGADRTGLECAKALGIKTGGTAPKGYRTEKGDDPTLKSEFGLKCDISESYPPRTKINVRDAEVTVWFGKTTSPGYWSTWGAAKSLSKPFIENPKGNLFRELCEHHEIINITGNRASTNPQVVDLVKEAFAALRLER